jgi:hypothetical protein
MSWDWSGSAQDRRVASLSRSCPALLFLLSFAGVDDPGTSGAWGHFPLGLELSMPTPHPNEPMPLPIPEPDVVRPPTPTEAPELDVPVGLPEPPPDIVRPEPGREVPPSRPLEAPPTGVPIADGLRRGT